jgi:hypothetical protein
MIRNLTPTDIRNLRFYVRNNVFKRIKFVGPEHVCMDSPLIQEMLKLANVASEDDKKRKFLGVKYILQRQLNSKRNYCSDKIIKECRGKLLSNTSAMFTRYCIIYGINHIFLF